MKALITRKCVAKKNSLSWNVLILSVPSDNRVFSARHRNSSCCTTSGTEKLQPHTNPLTQNTVIEYLLHVFLF